MAFSIVRDCGGVPGLHVALNVFSEEAERRLFAVAGPHPPHNSAPGKKFVDVIAHPVDYPAGVIRRQRLPVAQQEHA